MRWSRAAVLLGTLCSLGFAACAHVEPPPGGEEDREPPQLLAVRPDSLSVVAPFRDPVVFVFDERLSEQGLDGAVLVSPRTSAVQVSRRGNELRVALRGGWEADRIYQVTLRPTLQDLFNNRMQQPLQLVFSTGPQIPETLISGTVSDRITGRSELDVRVEAIRQPDSLVYAVPTDSAGRYTLGRIPEGEYRVRAFRDLNRDRVLDPFEPRDTGSVTISAGDTVTLAFRLVMPDTTPPAVANARPGAGGVIEVQFDDHLDPEQTITPAQIRITAPDGATVAVARAAVGRLEPAHTAAAPPAEPAQPRDTVAAPPAGPAEPAPPPAQQRPPVPQRPGAPGAAAGERLPSQTLAVEPATPLAPGTEYRIRVDNVRNVVGLVGGGETTLTIPAAPRSP